MKKYTLRNANYRILVIVLTILLTVFGITYIPQQASSEENNTSNESQSIDGLTQQIQKLTDGNARISMNTKTGMVRFIGTDLLNSISIPAALESNCNPEQVARSFLSNYGRLFGISDQANELSTIETSIVDNSRSFIHFQQVYEDTPILGGELIVQVDSNNSIISANGEILPKISLDVTPTISPSTAQETALGVVAKAYGLDIQSLTVSEPQLWICNPTILGLDQNITSLVWRIEVASTDNALVDELVLVDAQLGFVALHFNQVETAKDRDVYTAKSGGVCTDTLPGWLERSEGEDSEGYTEVDNAYTYTGYTYDYYSSEHGRDGIDNAGMTIISTVDWDEDGGCDYDNAGWSSYYSQMIFGTGYTSACDVVGHELTHGVTDYESNLFYFMQSGAINEGFSDIWGEFVELTYNPGAPSERWWIGENLPIGAIRSMKNPPTSPDVSQPDKMTSTYYYCGIGDNGGVHINSGIANKAAYLMVDGDTFNGYVVTGMGISKVADLFYEVQTNLLTSGSDYADLYDALQQAAINLGYNTSERQTVKNAIDATEMNHQPTSCPANEAPLCDSGTPYDLFFDDMENPASGNWTFGSLVDGNYWSYATGYATSGQYCLYGEDYEDIADYFAAMTSDVTLPADGQYYLHFRHVYIFDQPNYDGGVVEYSTNGGFTWNDAGSLFTHNSYTGTIDTDWGNPLGGRSAYVGYTRGYISSRLNLSSLAGQNVRFRFRIGTDDGWDALGWCIDDVRIYTCAYYLNTSASAGGTILSPGQGLTGPYAFGQVVNISATPNSCYYFVNWSGNTSTIANVSSPSTTITMNGSYSITANFATDPFSSGNGSTDNPYLIQDVCALQNMSGNLGAHYALANDIDASATSGWNSGAGFMPIGNNLNRFTGSFDGHGYTITGLFVNRTDTDYVGLFGYIGTGGVMSNASLVDADITGHHYVGGLVGRIEYGSLNNSSATGNVNGTKSIGGLVGYSNGSVSNSYATGNVSGTGIVVGGLVGFNYGSVSTSYSTGNVSGTNNYVGGLVGENDGTVNNSYATGNVSSTGAIVGGLAGYNEGTVSNSYSTGNVSGSDLVGGLMGDNYGSVSDSFWDTQTSGQSSSSGGTGKTTAEMKSFSTFFNAGWDFMCETTNGDEDIWGINEDGVDNDGYPFLSWQGLTYNIGFTLTINSSEYGNVSIPGEGPFGPYNCSETVNIAAAADPGYEFVSWSGNTTTIANPYSASTNITMNGNYSITANFGLEPVGLYGDANNDTYIDSTDISYVKLTMFMRWNPNPGIDASGDGIIDSTDISYIKLIMFRRWNASSLYEAPYDFLSSAGITRLAKINTIPAPPPTLADNFKTNSSGWVEATDPEYGYISTTDGTTWNIIGSSGNYSTLQCKFSVVENPADITSIGITINGSAETNGDILQFWAWNFNTGSWRKIGNNLTMTTSIATYTSWTNWGKVFTDYIDSGDIYILANLNNSNENLNIDYIKLMLAHP